METTFTFRNIESTDALKSHTLSKLEKLKKLLVKPETAHAILDVRKFHHQVEITINANGIQYVSHHTSENMYTSIDEAMHKLERQLVKSKEKLKNHHLSK